MRFAHMLRSSLKGSEIDCAGGGGKAPRVADPSTHSMHVTRSVPAPVDQAGCGSCPLFTFPKVTTPVRFQTPSTSTRASNVGSAGRQSQPAFSQTFMVGQLDKADSLDQPRPSMR